MKQQMVSFQFRNKEQTVIGKLRGSTNVFIGMKRHYYKEVAEAEAI